MFAYFGRKVNRTNGNKKVTDHSGHVSVGAIADAVINRYRSDMIRVEGSEPMCKRIG